MALNDAALNIGNAAIQAALTHGSIHTALPDAAGSNESTAARQPITWETAANGDMIVTADAPFTGGEASGPALYIGFWGAATGGTFYGDLDLSLTAGNDLAFNAAGEYTLTGVTITGSATG